MVTSNWAMVLTIFMVLYFSILSYPTFKYFNYGKNDDKYTGGRTKDDFIKFMANPQEPATPPPEEEQWSDEPSAVEHLTDDNFEDFLSKHDSMLVMFYAPCKQLFTYSFNYNYASKATYCSA